MNQPLYIYGYHGTNQEKASVIVQTGFNISANDYDWLGTGVYFFQDAPLRAWEWANQRFPENAAVIRSLIRLENCMDLFDIGWFPIIREAYNDFVEEYRKTNQTLPRQNPDRSKAHRLDCAYFNYVINQILEPQGETINSVRAIFLEGERIFPNSAIFDLAHVQIAVRNIAMIEQSQIIQI
jgi:hypothetical protein